MGGKKFDLNIEKILEDWEIYHAIREIIANAIDEEILTGTKKIEIFKDNKGRWHIRDFGRGLRYEHLTQKEVEEKLKNPNVIGKFGIGLKDALATFDRKGVKVFVKSRHGDITLGKSENMILRM
jgi:DNA gyrase/topoisomerase IV subunit B